MIIVIIIITVSGMYRSGMTILSGAPKRLSIVASPESFLSRADLMTSGVFWPRGLNACSMSRSSRDLADPWSYGRKYGLLKRLAKISLIRLQKLSVIRICDHIRKYSTFFHWSFSVSIHDLMQLQPNMRYRQPQNNDNLPATSTFGLCFWTYF